MEAAVSLEMNMSRSGYTDDAENLAMWRGMVASAIRGKRGQRLLRDLRDALDAMPTKRLIAGDFVRDGECCALGAVAVKRNVPDLDLIDPEDGCHHENVACELDIAECLVREIEYENDEGAWKETPEERWTRMRKWVENRIKPEPSHA